MTHPQAVHRLRHNGVEQRLRRFLSCIADALVLRVTFVGIHLPFEVREVPSMGRNRVLGLGRVGMESTGEEAVGQAMKEKIAGINIRGKIGMPRPHRHTRCPPPSTVRTL